MKFILSLATLLIMASITLAAEGEKGKGEKGKGEGKRDPEAMFKRLDADNDGAISKDEWNASPMAKKDADRAAKGFAARDKDADGKLTKEEFATAPARKGNK